MLRAGGAALLLGIPGGGALAQGGAVAATHGEWEIRCFIPEEGRGTETCALHQFVAAEGRPDADLRILVWRDADVGPVLQVVTPLDVRLRQQVSVTVDGEAIGRMEFERCTVDGCIAEVLIDDAALERFRTGTTALFGYHLVGDPAEAPGIGFPIGLEGFAEGFDALDNWPPAGG